MQTDDKNDCISFKNIFYFLIYDYFSNCINYTLSIFIRLMNLLINL